MAEPDIGAGTHALDPAILRCQGREPVHQAGVECLHVLMLQLDEGEQMLVPLRVPTGNHALHLAAFIGRRVARRQADHCDRCQRGQETLVRPLLISETQPLPLGRQPGDAGIGLKSGLIDIEPVLDMRDGEAALQHQAVGDGGGDVEEGIALQRR
jgi:hypothetical protein